MAEREAKTVVTSLRLSPELMLRVDAEAERERRTRNRMLVQILEDWVHALDTAKKATEVGGSSRIREVEVVPQKAAAGGGNLTCAICGKGLVPWGNAQVHCNGCGRNFPI